MIQNQNIPSDVSLTSEREQSTTGRNRSFNFSGFSIPLLLVTLIDFIVRSAYMTGKTPVLPLFAAALGAGEIYLGFISSISAFTGMALKPLIGVLSDRKGRRWWLFIGAAFFVAMPFLYRFISTPDQLVVVRLIHGLATAIYGPVTMAMVVEMSTENRAGRVGFFSLGRTGGYIIGPALGGFLLLRMDPVTIYTTIGIISSLALIPLFFLPETAVVVPQKEKVPLWTQLKKSMTNSATTPAVWISSGFEAMNYMVTYAAKAFLPIYALAVGRNALEAGLFFSIQQGVTMATKPVFGWLSDRWSLAYSIFTALIGMTVALFMLTASANILAFFGAAILLGLAEALIIPAATALLAFQIDPKNVGGGLGIVGSLRNASKIAGPIIAGFLIALTNYELTFQIMGGLTFLGAILLMYGFHSGILTTEQRE